MMAIETSNKTDNRTESAKKPESTEPLTVGQRLGKFWRDYVKSFLIIVITLTAFRSAVADWNDVPTGSMRPTILEGDRIFVNKAAYGLKVPFTTIHLLRWDRPDRGEIVVFFSPEDGRRMVKRVVGVPGDKVELKENRLYINDQPLIYGPDDASFASALPPQEQRRVKVWSETLGNAKHAIIDDPDWRARRTYGPVMVPAGKYFLMGDNRDNSRDSREYGFVPESQIVGRSSRVAVSVDPQRSYRPRWERFFKSMP